MADPLILDTRKLSTVNGLVNSYYGPYDSLTPTAGQGANIVRPGSGAPGSISNTRDYRSSNFGQSVPYPQQPFIGPVYNPTTTSPLTDTGGLSGAGGGVPGTPPINNTVQSAYDAELSSANSAFDYNKSQLEGQLSSLGSQKSNTLAELQNALSGVQTNVNQQKTDTKAMGEEQTGQAGSTAKNTQRSNRNVLRALGILNSTYATDALMSPMNQFDIQRAQIGQQVMTNVKKLDDFYNQQLASHQQAVKSVEDQYTSLVGQIQNDLRFNERQRLDAVKSANSALQQRLYEIGQSFTSYRNTVDTQKQNLALQLAQLQIANPTADMSGILQTSMVNAGNLLSGKTSQTASIYNPDGTLKKQGLDLNKAFNSGGLTLSGFGQQ